MDSSCAGAPISRRWARYSIASLAAQNKDVTTTDLSWIHWDNNSPASADAMAPASVSQTAQAQAKAEAENDTTVDLVRNTQSSTTITDIILTTSDQLNVQGSSVDAGGDVRSEEHTSELQYLMRI